MSRPIRLASALVSTVLALALSIGAAPEVRAEDATIPAPRPTVAADSVSLGAPPTNAGRHPGGPKLVRGTGGASEPTRTGRISLTSTEAPLSADTVYGWVWDGYSQDMAEGVTVKIWQKDNISNEPNATAVTDESGYYSLGTLPPGQYLLWFGRDGLISEWWDNTIWGWLSATVLTIPDDQTSIEANAELDYWGSVTGTVANAKGKPVPNAWVRLLVWDDVNKYWGEWESRPTDNSGRFIFPDLRPGIYAVEEYRLPKGSRLKSEGSYVSLLSHDGTKTGGLLEPWVKGAPGTGVLQKTDVGAGSWKRTTFSYQWLRDGARIPGATKQTYTPGTADIGRRLQVRVTSKQGNNWVTVVSPTTWPIILAPLPRIEGPLAVGSEVTATGLWQAGAALRYQWYANSKAISGATGSSLVLTGSQKAKRISVTVTGNFSDYPAVSRTSATTAKVATAGTPTVSGRPLAGATLKAKPGTWTKKTKLRYQWLRNGAAIRKATKSTYKLTAADAGAAISVRVTGKLSGYATVSKISAEVGIPA